MYLILVAILGLCIGSFLNVCIYRIAREENIAFPQSHCTSCGYKLKSKDLVPVLSYIFLRGRCRKCNEKISIKYPLVEILNCIIYILIYLKFGFSLELFKYSLLASLLIVIGFVDFETKFVYNSTVIFGVISGIIFIILEWISTKNFPADNIIGAILGFLIIWLIVVLTHGMGEGEIDISLICGLFLGVKGIIVTLFLAVVLGGIVATIILLTKAKDKKEEIAFGPYLAIGGIIAILYGNTIINIYMNTL